MTKSAPKPKPAAAPSKKRRREEEDGEPVLSHLCRFKLAGGSVPDEVLVAYIREHGRTIMAWPDARRREHERALVCCMRQGPGASAMVAAMLRAVL